MRHAIARISVAFLISTTLLTVEAADPVPKLPSLEVSAGGERPDTMDFRAPFVGLKGGVTRSISIGNRGRLSTGSLSTFYNVVGNADLYSGLDCDFDELFDTVGCVAGARASVDGMGIQFSMSGTSDPGLSFGDNVFLGDDGEPGHDFDLIDVAIAGERRIVAAVTPEGTFLSTAEDGELIELSAPNGQPIDSIDVDTDKTTGRFHVVYRAGAMAYFESFTVGPLTRAAGPEPLGVSDPVGEKSLVVKDGIQVLLLANDEFGTSRKLITVEYDGTVQVNIPKVETDLPPVQSSGSAFDSGGFFGVVRSNIVYHIPDEGGLDLDLVEDGIVVGSIDDPAPPITRSPTGGIRGLFLDDDRFFLLYAVQALSHPSGFADIIGRICSFVSQSCGEEVPLATTAIARIRRLSEDPLALELDEIVACWEELIGAAEGSPYGSTTVCRRWNVDDPAPTSGTISITSSDTLPDPSRGQDATVVEHAMAT